MQPLSPRAAQAHTYTCISCAARLNLPITRTAISTNRLRKPKFSKTSAAFFTTVLASTTAHNGRLRSDQRKGTRKLLRANRKIVAYLRQVSSLAARDKKNQTVPGFSYEPVETLSSICRKIGEPLVRHDQNNQAYKNFLFLLHKLRGPGEKLGLKAPISPRYPTAVLERAIKEERIHFVEHREPLTDIQFQKYHDMINRLVDDLIKQTYFDEVPMDPELARRNIESLDSAWTAIRLLRSEGYPRYKHPMVDPIAAVEARNKLSETIDSLLELNRDELRMKPKFQVAKICYNLLVCEFPPTIHHYNALILGFSQQNMSNLVDLVAASLLQDSRLRSSPQTIVCLLVHYQRTWDIQGFFSIMQRLVAADTRGLLQTRRWLREKMRIPPYVRPWAKKNEAAFPFGGRFAIKLPERKPDIYEALIFGLLAFGRTKDAVKALLASIREGVGISLGLFLQVIQHSLYRLDTPTIRLLARGLHDHVDVAVWSLLDDNGPRKMAEHMYALFSVLQPIPGTLSEERIHLVRSSRWMFIPHDHDGPARLLAIAIFIRHAEQKLYQLGHILRFANKLISATIPTQRCGIAVSTEGRLRRFSLQDDERVKLVQKRRKLLRLIDTLRQTTWGLNTHNVVYTHERIVRIIGSTFPTCANLGSPEQRKHKRKLEMLANRWILYRTRKKEGITGVTRRLLAEAEMSLQYGEKLMQQCEAWASPRLRPTNARDSEQVVEDEVEADWLQPGSGLQLN